jgi:hypothetical protein
VELAGLVLDERACSRWLASSAALAAALVPDIAQAGGGAVVVDLGLAEPAAALATSPEDSAPHPGGLGPF